MPEGARGTGRAWPVPSRVGQSAQLKPEAAADRHIEGTIDLAVNLHASIRSTVSGRRMRNAVKRPTSGDRGVEAGHVAGGGDAGRGGNHHSMEPIRLI